MLLPPWVDRLGCVYYSLHRAHDDGGLADRTCNQSSLQQVVAVEDVMISNQRTVVGDAVAAAVGQRRKFPPKFGSQETPLVWMQSSSDVHWDCAAEDLVCWRWLALLAAQRMGRQMEESKDCGRKLHSLVVEEERKIH